MDLTQDQIQSMISDALDARQRTNAFGVSLIPSHFHTGTDSGQIDYSNLTNKPTIPAAVTDATISTSDITTNNVSTTKHGWTPKAPNDTAKFLRGDATYAFVPISHKAGGMPTQGTTDAFKSPTFTADTTGIGAGSNIYTSFYQNSGGGFAWWIYKFGFNTTNNQIYNTGTNDNNTFQIGTGQASQVKLAILGSFVYARAVNGTPTLVFRRLDLGTLANATTMSFSGGSVTLEGTMFTDGTYLYLQDNSTTTVKKYSVSGTTATFVSSATFTSIGTNAAWCDGTNVYQWSGITTIRKWPLSGGSPSTLTWDVTNYDTTMTEGGFINIAGSNQAFAFFAGPDIGSGPTKRYLNVLTVPSF